MGYRGTVNGNVIELEEPLPFAPGSRVEVAVRPAPQPRKNSPEAWMALAGTLTHEEAELIRKGAAEARRIDPRLWEELPE